MYCDSDQETNFMMFKSIKQTTFLFLMIVFNDLFIGLLIIFFIFLLCGHLLIFI